MADLQWPICNLPVIRGMASHRSACDPVLTPGVHLRRAAATILVIAYLAALAGFLCLQALGDSGLAPLSYFFTWDMFPSYSSESSRRVAVGETAAGTFVRR